MLTQSSLRLDSLPSRRVGLKAWWGTLLVGLIGGILAAPELLAPLENSIFDAGITTSAGTFIRHGQLPYRDFWLLYGPLSGYLAAVIATVFGNDVAVLRAAGLIVVVATAMVCHRIVVPYAPAIPAIVIAILAATIPVYHTGVDLAAWSLALLFALAAVLVGRDRSPRAIVVAGLLVGVATLCRADFGAYALIAVVIETRSLKPTLAAAAVVIPVAAIFVLLVPIASLFEQLVEFPILGYGASRGIPAPALIGFSNRMALSWILYWIPLLVIALAIVRRIRTGSMPPGFLGILILAILGRLQTVVRPDDFHSAEVLTPVVLLAGYIIPWPLQRVERVALVIPLGIAFALAAMPLTWIMAPRSPYDAALKEAAAIVRERTLSDEPIFVGEARNLHTWLNPLVAYTLADRASGVHDTMYTPGLTNTERIQRRMVTDLRANGVRYLILDVRYADCLETSNESRTLGSAVLDEAIGRDYRVLADLGAIVIMVRRGDPSDIVAGTVWVDPQPPPNEGARVCDGSHQQP